VTWASCGINAGAALPYQHLHHACLPSLQPSYRLLFRTKISSIAAHWPPLWSGGQSSCLHNGDVLCFLRGTDWIYICYVEESRPPLWPSGQSSWLQIQKSGLDSRRHQISSAVVCLERGPLSLVSTTEKLLEIKSCGSGLENSDYGRRDPPHWPRESPLCTKNWH
jgi:hypothetical protein